MTYEAFHNAERAGWHARAGDHDGITAQATGQIVPALFAALALRPGIDLLHLACGQGHVSAAPLVRTLDLDVAMTNSQALPCDDPSFDAVCCDTGLSQVADPQTVMAQDARVLRRKGRIAFSQSTAPAGSARYARLAAVLLRCGVRVPPGIKAYSQEAQDRLRACITAAMAASETGRGPDVPMPSLLHVGTET